VVARRCGRRATTLLGRASAAIRRSFHENRAVASVLLGAHYNVLGSDGMPPNLPMSLASDIANRGFQLGQTPPNEAGTFLKRFN
jgi:hypothetical protein